MELRKREWLSVLWGVGMCALALVVSGWVLGLFVLVALLALHT